jgi:hypothetical protein
MGHLGIDKNNPDLYAVEVANEVLSGASRRLFSNVRSKKASPTQFGERSIPTDYPVPSMSG